MFNQDVALGAEVFHKWADEANDSHDHDEHHAAGAVMSLLNGAMLTQTEFDYIVRWMEGLSDLHS